MKEFFGTIRPGRAVTAGAAVGLAAIALLAAALTGCSSGKEAAADPGTTENQELALQYFLAGSMLDQKGEHAKAVLEYQDALKYKRDPAIYHAISKDYSILGKHDLAIANAAEAVRIEPSSMKYRQALAEIHLNARDLRGAVAAYEEMVKLDSTDRVTRINLARLYQMSDPDRAIAMYEWVLEKFGTDPDALVPLAHLYSARGDLAKATDVLKRLSDLEPTNLEVRRALGDLYIQQDSVDTGLAILNEIADLHPEDLEVRAAIAHAWLIKQDYDRAAEQFESVFHGDSLEADDQIRFGQIFVSFVEEDSAVLPYARTLFLKIRERFPDDWRPCWFLGALSNIAGDDSSALVWFGRVTDLAAWNPDGWIGVASVYYDAGEFRKAIDVLNEAKNNVPDEFRLYFLLGISYQRDGERIGAATALERAIQLNENSVDALTALALVYDELGEKAQSDTIYERGLRLDPDNHLMLNNYSYSLSERGLQLERALEMSAEALRQQPENQSYLDTYGWILYMLGRYSEALEYVNRAIALGNASAVLHEHMGDIYYKLSEAGRAMEYWKKALELDPSNTSLSDKIRRGSL